MRRLDIAPTDLLRFLQAHGWRMLDRARDFRKYAFSHQAYPRRQLVYPMDADAPDYKESVFSVLEKFAEITGKAYAGVLSSVENFRNDVIRVRIFGRSNDFDIPLSFASELVPSAEKIIKAAACTVLRPKLHHPRLTLTEANQLVEKSRFGQTEEGSFILKVSCPLDALGAQSALGLSDEDAPFVRQVTHSFWKAVGGLANAIESDSLDAFVRELKTSDAPMVSSNFCEALYAMHDEQIDNSVEFSVEPSVLSAVGVLDFQRHIRFQRDYFSRIEEVRRELRAVELYRDDTFVGTVERLDGELGDDGRRLGTVILDLLPRGETETVRAKVFLTPEQYIIADQAHMNNGCFVMVTGRLRPGRQPLALTDISYFGLLQEQSSSQIVVAN